MQTCCFAESEKKSMLICIHCSQVTMLIVEIWMHLCLLTRISAQVFGPTFYAQVVGPAFSGPPFSAHRYYRLTANAHRHTVRHT